MQRLKRFVIVLFVGLNVLVCIFTILRIRSDHRQLSSDVDSSIRRSTSSVDETKTENHGGLEGNSRKVDLRVRTVHRKSNNHNSFVYNHIFEPVFKNVTSLDYCNSHTSLLIAVCSSAQNLDRRETIRSTWGNAEHLSALNVMLMFVVGRPEMKFQYVEELLDEEKRQFGDILQLNHTDHYANLTLKSIGMLKWASTKCSQSKYFAKTDDDVIVNVANLLRLLREIFEKNEQDQIVGHVIEDASPVRDRKSRWFTPVSVFSGEVFPPYLSGTAYAMNTGLVGNIYHASLDNPIFWLEDVYLTGMLPIKLKIDRIHDGRFQPSKKQRSVCWYLTAIAEHGRTAEEIHDIWNFLTNSDEHIHCHRSNVMKEVGEGQAASAQIVFG